MTATKRATVGGLALVACTAREGWPSPRSRFRLARVERVTTSGRIVWATLADGSPAKIAPGVAVRWVDARHGIDPAAAFAAFGMASKTLGAWARALRALRQPGPFEVTAGSDIRREVLRGMAADLAARSISCGAPGCSAILDRADVVEVAGANGEGRAALCGSCLDADALGVAALAARGAVTVSDYRGLFS